MHILRKRVEKGNCDLFTVTKDKYWGFVKIYLLRPQLYGEKLSLPAKSTVASIYMRKENKTELLVISSLHGAPLLCHIFTFVMREHWLHQEWVTLEFSSTNL